MNLGIQKQQLFDLAGRFFWTKIPPTSGIPTLVRLIIRIHEGIKVPQVFWLRRAANGPRSGSIGSHLREPYLRTLRFIGFPSCCSSCQSVCPRDWRYHDIPSFLGLQVLPTFTIPHPAHPLRFCQRCTCPSVVHAHGPWCMAWKNKLQCSGECMSDNHIAEAKQFVPQGPAFSKMDNLCATQTARQLWLVGPKEIP